MITVLEILLIVNIGMAVLFLIIERIKKMKSGSLTIFFLFLPILGFVLYGIAVLYLHFKNTFTYDRESLVRRTMLEQEQKHPVIQEELNVVPVAEAMAVSNLHEKRFLVLDQLRKNIGENYKYVLGAENDKDSESAHYVATAKMEVYKRLQVQWEAVKSKYQQEPDNIENFHEMLKMSSAFIRSEVLSEKEQELFMRRYCDLFMEQYNADHTVFINEEESDYMRYLAKLGKDIEVADFFDTMLTKKNETSYLVMLSVLYRLKRKEAFYNRLEELEHDRGIHLSAEGVEMLRYWRERKKENVVS